MNEETSRRQILKSVGAGAAAATGLFAATGSANASGSDPGPVPDVPYQVVTYGKEVFAPQVLAIPAGSTVTFTGNQHPHTITSTESLTDILVGGCGDGTEPYSGDAEADNPDQGPDGTKDDDDVIRYTVESDTEDYSVFLESGGTSEITYEAVGQYPYYCIPHCGSYMMGRIDVVDVPEDVPVGVPE